MNDNSSHKKVHFFYGWIIAFASGLGIAFSVMAFIPTTIGVLAAPLSIEFGWSPAQIFLAPTFATVATVLIAPFLGAIVDRFGARRVITFSFIVEALLIASFRYIDSNIGLFYARYAALALLATGTTTVPFMKIISRWFDRHRGLAIGIALVCYGLGGMIWSLMSQFLFDLVGWRESFIYMGGLVLFIILPILLIFIRDTPESMGHHMDGVSDETAAAIAVKPDLTGMPLSQALREGQFWKIAFSFFFVAAVVQGIMVNLIPLLTSNGVSAQAAASIQASLWGAMVLGRISAGWMMDHMFAPRVALIFLIPAIIGVLTLGLGFLGVAAVLGAMLVGLANGSEGDIVPYITSRYYGLKHYTKIYGIFFSCFAMGSGFGYPMTAYLVEKAGGYHIIIWTHIGALLVAGLIFFTFQRFPKSHPI